MKSGLPIRILTKIKAELKAIEKDENEIKERFYKELEFGTAGLRGVIGAGTNRMNIYTVRKTTQGLANYIAAVGDRPRALPLPMIPPYVTGLQKKQPLYHSQWRKKLIF